MSGLSSFATVEKVMMLPPRVRFLVLGPLGILVMFAAVTTPAAKAETVLDIEINYSGDPAFQPYFDHAELVWERILDYQDVEITTGFGFFANTTSIGPLVIDAGVFSFAEAGITNPPGGNILAQAGPRNGVRDNSGFLLVTSGIAQFDLDDIGQNPDGSVELTGDGDFLNVVLHEFGHILGFVPQVWEGNGVYDSANQATATELGQYTGSNGLAAYNAEFGLNETFVPIENGGPDGTANAHLDEEFFGIALDGNTTVLAETNISNIRFGPNADELLTGVISDEIFISNTTGGIFQDIGFSVDFDAIASFNAGEFAFPVAVPEPSSPTLLFSVFLLNSVRRYRLL